MYMDSTLTVWPPIPSLVPRPTPFFSVFQFALTDAEERCGELLRRSSISVYYCQQLKNRKNGVGLGTRLSNSSVQARAGGIARST